jgi:hypothetical protein
MDDDAPVVSPPESAAPDDKGSTATEGEAAEVVVPEPTPAVAAADADAELQMRRMSRRSFLWGAVAVGAGYTGLRWLVTRRQDDGIPWPFRRALETDEQVARDYFKTTRLAPTFDKTLADPDPRVNGDLGLGADFNPATWKLTVDGVYGQDDTIDVGLHAIKALPPVKMVTELKCIEGWSIFVQWTGARLVDFMAKYPPATRDGTRPDVHRKPDYLVRYVGMSTPDEGYYIGLEMESALHPQTLLCYEMNDKPLTPEHGAPLRLVVPVKYGIKNIKRIGTIKYTDQRPADYWAEQGYDWYAGH